MTVEANLSSKTVIITGACHTPGPEVTIRLAEAGARVVAIDKDVQALLKLSANNPAQINTLVKADGPIDTLRHFGEAWQAEPIHAVVNLLPLEGGPDLNHQISVTTALFKAMGRGLMAGQGRLISVCERPADELALKGHALVAALAAAHTQWAAATAKCGGSVHTVVAQENRSADAADAVLSLIETADVESGRVDIG